MEIINNIKRLFGIPSNGAATGPNDAVRRTEAYWRMAYPGGMGSAQPLVRPTVRNLRGFARTPYARRAINAVKNPIAALDFEIVARPGAGRDAGARARLVRACLDRPNEDDGFRSLIEQVLEDILAGAGAIEQRRGDDPARPFMLWPVDGLSIEVNPDWDGAGERYRQTGVGGGVSLQNDELIYLRPNRSTHSPFGLGPL